MNLNLASLWEAVADAVGTREAVIQQGRSVRYRELDDSAARLASVLAAAGVSRGDRVGCCMYSSPEYVITIFALFKLGATPVNLNYRYRGTELTAVVQDASAVALVFDARLADHVESAVGAVPSLRCLIEVSEDGLGPRQPRIHGAVGFGEALSATPLAREPRGGNDQLFVYTGGTTGLPKGVVWSHGDLLEANSPSIWPDLPDLPTTVGDAAEVAVRRAGDDRVLILPPLMHGTGLYATINTLSAGGTVILAPSRSFQPAAVWRSVMRDRPARMIITGDAVARPMADELERASRAGQPYDLSSLTSITSCGVRWSDDVKQSLLEHGSMSLIDVIAATECPPAAVAVTTSTDELPTQFRLTPGATVIDDEGHEVAPGSDGVGRLSFSGAVPSGYHGDEAKTRTVFSTDPDGSGRVTPGDYVRVLADGSLMFMGRGSMVINTGGEKVYPPEVEEALLSHPGISDCAVMGLPDSRWGETVAALIVTDSHPLSPDELNAFLDGRLAGYKRPRTVVLADEIPRGPNAKLDLVQVRQMLEGPAIVTPTASFSTSHG